MSETATELPERLERQRAAFMRARPDYGQRMQALAALRDAVHAREQELIRCIAEDFGARAPAETRMLELFPLYHQIGHARRHLRAWMRRRRVPGSWFLLPARAFYQYQPLGVVGVMGAWNYPVLLLLGPLVDALAAGNHVLLKPSEMAPKVGAALARLIAETFPAEQVSCVTGDAELAGAFSALPFDHLIFTGSTRVGKQVMAAAARHLTPLTLELGGKSPAIVHDSYPLHRAAARIMTAKLYNAGQTCVAPDYVLLPEGREAEFEAQVRHIVKRLYPRLGLDADYTQIASDRHFERLRALIDDAAGRGARVVEIDPTGGAGERGRRVIAPTLIFAPPEASAVMREEIFGPLLPVLTYRTLDEALAFVNARPRPLALYYFDDDRARQDQVLAQTLSGGVTFNDCLFHLAQIELPFGGVGASGMGHYHGFDGFVTFSKKRPVMRQGRLATTALLRPPWRRRSWLLELLQRLARGR